jgi:hypothetical protein
LLFFKQILAANVSLMTADKNELQNAVMRIMQKDTEQPGLEILSDEGRQVMHQVLKA